MIRFEVVSVQELVDEHFGPFKQDTGTAWNLSPVATVPTISPDDLMRYLEEDEGECDAR